MFVVYMSDTEQNDMDQELYKRWLKQQQFTWPKVDIDMNQSSLSLSDSDKKIYYQIICLFHGNYSDPLE